MGGILIGYSTDVSETFTKFSVIFARFLPKRIQKALLVLEKKADPKISSSLIFGYFLAKGVCKSLLELCTNG